MKSQSLTVPVVVLVIVLLTVGSLNVPRYFYLSWKGVVSDAQITIKEPENHRLIRYSFSINGQTFSGVQGVSDEITKVSVGQTIQIYYYATDPTINCYCEPRQNLIAESVVALLASLTAALFIGLSIRFRSRVKGK